MMVPSIGQALSLISSASCAKSSADDTSGTAHIIPTIWQGVKSRTRLKDRIFTVKISNGSWLDNLPQFMSFVKLQN